MATSMGEVPYSCFGYSAIKDRVIHRQVMTLPGAAILVLVLLLVAVSPLCAEPAVIRLGAVLPQTGPLAIQGVPMRNAMLLAEEQFDSDNRLEIIFEDDEFIPRKTVSAVAKLIEKDKVHAIAVFGTNQGLAVAEIINRAALPFLSINVNRKVVLGYTNAFLFMPSVEDLMAGTIREIVRRRYKRVAIVASIQDSTLLQRDIIADSGVVTVTASEDLDSGDTDGRAVALRLLTGNPEAIFLSTMPPQGSMMAKRLRGMGFKGELFGGLQLANRSEFKASDGALLGAWVVAGDDRLGGEFLTAYRVKFKEEPTAEAMYAYDVVTVLLKVSEGGGNMLQNLRTLERFTGVAGEATADGYHGFKRSVVAKEFIQDGFNYME